MYFHIVAIRCQILMFFVTALRHSDTLKVVMHPHISMHYQMIHWVVPHSAPYHLVGYISQLTIDSLLTNIDPSLQDDSPPYPLFSAMSSRITGWSQILHHIIR